MAAERKLCPHCQKEMTPWRPPADSSWGQQIQFVCFNDACPYYLEGWRWMKETYNAVASYRHRYDPSTDSAGPLPVWSPDAQKNGIVSEQEATEAHA